LNLLNPVIRSHSAIIRIIITCIMSKRLLRGKARDQFVLSISFEVKSPRAFEKISNPPVSCACSSDMFEQAVI